MRNYKVVDTKYHVFRATFPHQIAKRTLLFFWKRLDDYYSSKEAAQTYCDQMNQLKGESKWLS